MKKYAALFLALALMLTALTGCGNTNSNTSQSDTSGGDGEQINLEFWHSMGGTTGELVQEIVDEFNASQDEIHVECIYQGDYTTGGTKIQAAVSAGNGPAIAQIEITRVGMYAEAGCLLDLTPYAEADTEFDVDDLYPGVMDFSYYDGKLVSLPNGRSVPVMYYNVDALKAAGFDEAPSNWEELRAAAAATTDPEKGVYGYGCPLGDSWYYLALMLTAGGQVYNEEGNNIGFYNESGTKPLQLWLDMMSDGSLYLPDGDDYSSLSALRNSFMAGICTITMQSSAQYRSLADNSDFEVVAYKLLSYAYECARAGAMPSWSKAEEVAGCNPLLFRTVARSLGEDGYIGKARPGVNPDDGSNGCWSDELRVTMSGVRFLQDNSSMGRVRTFLGSAFKSVLSAAIEATFALGTTGV